MDGRGGDTPFERYYNEAYAKGKADAKAEMRHFDKMQFEFMQACGQQYHTIVELLECGPRLHQNALQAISLWHSLIDEEVNKELRPFLLDTFFSARHSANEEEMLNALTRIADDIGDSIYVLCGLANCLGIPLAEVYQEIHRTNMQKTIPDGQGGYTVRRRADGKILKPDNWEPPNIKAILRKTIARVARNDSER